MEYLHYPTAAQNARFDAFVDERPNAVRRALGLPFDAHYHEIVFAFDALTEYDAERVLARLGESA